MSRITRIRRSLGTLLLALAVPSAVAGTTTIVPGLWICNERLPDGRENVTEVSYAADGTFSGRSLLEGQEDWNYAGRWRIENGTLISVYDRSSKPLAVSARTATDRVMVLNTAVMVVVSGPAGQRTYLRSD